MLQLVRLLFKRCTGLLLILALCTSRSAFGQIANDYLPGDPAEQDTTWFSYYHHPDYRTITNLNGKWDFSSEDADEVVRVRVPGSYKAQDKRVFERTFSLDSSFVDKSYTLNAFGVNYRCEVFINDQYIGKHVGGYLPFRMRIPHEFLSIGRNRIRVAVDNKLHSTTSIPLSHHPGLPYNYGGILRDIFIVASPRIHIEDIKVGPGTIDSVGTATVKANVALRYDASQNEADSARVILQVSLVDTARSRTVATELVRDLLIINSKAEQQFELTFQRATAWHIQNPHLYELRVTLLYRWRPIDEMRAPVGLRQISLTGGQLHLNHSPIRLDGVDWHEYFAQVGPSPGAERLEREVERIKDLGANAIRVVGATPHPYLLSLCQQAGLLVFVEAPLSFVPPARFADPGFVRAIEDYYKEVLGYVGSFASVAAVGLGTDLPFCPAANKAFSGVLRKGKEEAGLLLYIVSRTQPPFACTSPIDFWLVEQRYILGQDDLEGTLADLDLWGGTPYILSAGVMLEGAGKSRAAGEPARAAQSVVEERQAYGLQRLLRHLRGEEESETGLFVQSLADWPLSRPSFVLGSHSKPFLSRSGLFDSSREPRLALEVVRARYRRSEEYQVPEHTFPEARPVAFPIVGIGSILLFLFYYKRSKRFQEYIRRVFRYPHSFYMELKDNRKVAVGHTIFLSFMICTILSVTMSSIFYRLRNSQLFDELLDLFIFSDGIKVQLIKLAWQPELFILLLFILSYLSFLGLVVLLRVISFILAQNLPTRQFFAAAFWICANFIWLLPLVPIYYRIISKPGWMLPALCIPVAFTLWSVARFFRGLKVIYMLNTLKTLFLAVVVLVVVLGALGWYYDRRSALFDYLPAYWNLVTEGRLSSAP